MTTGFHRHFSDFYPPPSRHAEHSAIDDYLEDTYGGLRAPLYLKAQEIQEQDIFNNPTAVRLYDAPRMPIVELNDKFASRRTTYLIWAVAKDGALLIGKEFEVKIDDRLEKCGHPSITAFQPPVSHIHTGLPLDGL